MGLAVRSPAVMVFLLVVLFTILFIFFAPDKLYAKVKEGSDDWVDRGLSGIKSEKIKEQGGIMPEETKDFFYDLKEVFEKIGSKCLAEHPDLSKLGDYNIVISNNEKGMSIRLIEGDFEEGKVPIKWDTIEGKHACVVAGISNGENVAENFFEYYGFETGKIKCCVCEDECSSEKKCEIKEIYESQTCSHYFGTTGPAPSMSSRSCDMSLCETSKIEKIYHSPSLIKIGKNSIEFDNIKSELKDDNLMFVDGNSTCFFPTNTYLGRCKRGDEKGLDEECIPKLKEKINTC